MPEYYRGDDGAFRFVHDDSPVEDPAAKGAVEIYRRSDLEAAACPHRYQNEDRRLTSGVAERGKVNHDIIREYINHLFFLDKTADYDAAIEIRDKHLATAVLEPLLRDEVLSGIERFTAHFRLDRDRYIAHEERLVVVPLRFTCALDLVYARGATNLMSAFPVDPDSELEIVDWKSYAGSFVGNVFDYFQARTYAVAAARRWPGYANYRFTFLAVSTGQSASESVPYTTVKDWEGDITARVALIQACEKTGRWPVQPGRVCAYCVADCPIVPLTLAGPEVGAFRVVDGDVAVATADTIVALQRAIKRRQDALKPWCKENGHVEHGDGELLTGFRPTKKRWVTFTDIATITSEEDVLPENIEIAASKMKGMAKGDGKCASRLRDAVQEKAGTRFSTWKAGSDDDD